MLTLTQQVFIDPDTTILPPSDRSLHEFVRARAAMQARYEEVRRHLREKGRIADLSKPEQEHRKRLFHEVISVAIGSDMSTDSD